MFHGFGAGFRLALLPTSLPDFLDFSPREFQQVERPAKAQVV
jgi:hypothetical protein